MHVIIGIWFLWIRVEQYRFRSCKSSNDNVIWKNKEAGKKGSGYLTLERVGEIESAALLVPQEALLAFVAEEEEDEDDEVKSLGVKILAYWHREAPRLSPRPNSSSASSGYDEEASDDNNTILSSFDTVEIDPETETPPPNSIRPRVSFIKSSSRKWKTDKGFLEGRYRGGEECSRRWERVGTTCLLCALQRMNMMMIFLQTVPIS